MRIDVKAISRTTGASLEIETIGRPDEIALSFPGYEFSSPVKLEGVVSNAGKEGFVVKGTVRAEWTSQCARCLTEVVSHTEAELDVLFRSSYQKDQTAQDNADPEEDYTFQGFSLVLDRAVRDSLILALPSRVLCREDCAGICAGCGANRNSERCRCDAV